MHPVKSSFFKSSMCDKHEERIDVYLACIWLENH